MQFRIRSLLAIAIMIGALAGHRAEAQAPAYQRTPGDTLRFREVTNGQMTITAPQGEVTMQTMHEALIAVTFGSADTATAWYEQLALGVEGMGQSMRPSMDVVIGQPFTLQFGERGQVRTVSTPPFPPEVGQLSDLARQFDDFFLRLPGEPLRAGLTWSDTVTHSDSTSATEVRHMRRAGSYRVERDTVVAGEQAVIIAATMRTTVDAVTVIPGQGIPARANLAGDEQGTFVFAPGSGRFLGRVRSGSIAGTIMLDGPAGSTEMGQRLTYQSTIEAVR